jgi:hypothetical protein
MSDDLERAVSDEERASYHEAAHATACVLLNNHVVFAKVEPHPDSGLHGLVRHRYVPPTPDDDEEPLLHTLVICLAGGAAEAKLLTRDITLTGSDAVEARRLVSCFTPPLADMLLGVAAREAVAFVKARWPLIAAVAHELLAKRTLGHREVCMVCAEVLNLDVWGVPPAEPESDA